MKMHSLSPFRRQLPGLTTSKIVTQQVFNPIFHTNERVYIPTIIQKNESDHEQRIRKLENSYHKQSNEQDQNVNAHGQGQANDLKQKNNELVQEIAKKNKEINNLKQAHKDISKGDSNLSLEIKRLKDLLKIKEQEISQLKQILENSKVQLNEQVDNEEKMNYYEQQLSIWKTRYQQLENSRNLDQQSDKKQIQQLQHQIDRNNEEIYELRVANDQLKLEIQENQQNHNDKIRGLGQEIENSSKTMQIKCDELDSMQLELMNLKKLYDGLKDKYNFINQQKMELEQQSYTSLNQIDLLKQQLEEQTRMISQLRKESYYQNELKSRNQQLENEQQRINDLVQIRTSALETQQKKNQRQEEIILLLKLEVDRYQQKLSSYQQSEMDQQEMKVRLENKEQKIEQQNGEIIRLNQMISRLTMEMDKFRQSQGFNQDFELSRYKLDDKIKSQEQKIVLLASEMERLKMQNLGYLDDLQKYENMNKNLEKNVEQLLIQKEQNSYLHQEIERLEIIIQEQSRNMNSQKKYNHLRESLNKELQRTIQKQEQNCYEVKPFRKNSLYSFQE